MTPLALITLPREGARRCSSLKRSSGIQRVDALAQDLVRELTLLNFRTQLFQIFLNAIHHKLSRIEIDQGLNRILLQELADGRKTLQNLTIRGHG